MSYSLGSATITPGVKGSFTSINSGIQGIIVGNLSGYSLSVQLEGGATAKTLYPGTADFFQYFYGFSGVIFWVTTSTVNIQNIPGSTINFDAVGKTENFNSSVYPMSIAVVQSVNPTATGNPLFTTFFGLGSTAGNNQSLNLFNPANSGVIATIHSAKGFTNSPGVPTLNLIYLSGADLNFSGSANAKSQQGSATPPVSVMHVTTDDSNNSFGGTALEVGRQPGSTTQGTIDLKTFPDTATLFPGGNMRLSLADTTNGHTIGITLKWSELTQVPPSTVTGATAVANVLDQESGVVGATFIKSVIPGTGTIINITDDGVGTYNVDQSGTLHQAFKFNSSGNPLQQGQAGDIMELLGQLQVDQATRLLTTLAVLGSSSLDNANITTDGSGNFISSLTSTATIAFKPSNTGAVTNGSSGNLTFYTPIWSNGLKLALVAINGYINGSGVTLSLPSSLTRGFFWYGPSGALTVTLENSGVAQTSNILTTLAAAGGATTNQTTINTASIGFIETTINQIVFSSVASGITSSFLLIGV